MIERLSLANRRRNETVPVKFITSSGGEQEYEVTFGFGNDGLIKECFCSPSETLRVGTDLQAMISDASIAISLLLQRGETIETLAWAFGENRPEGAQNGPPSSPLGAIARAGVEVEKSQ